MASSIPQVDVFISGAGPVGLILAYHLTKLGRSVHIVDAADKASPDFPMYGRACALFPRSQELLDALDLYDDMAQEALHSKATFTYSGETGRRVIGRGWNVFSTPTKYSCFFDEFLNLRLKYSEDIFRSRLEELGGRVHAPWKVIDLDLLDTEDEYKCRIQCVDLEGKSREVRAKYVVGADGGSSAVRQLVGIPFPVLLNDRHWVRVDGLVKTNLPEARAGIGAIESPTHGHVLWAPLDHGATRIGYVLSEDLYKKYGRSMTPEQAVYEAKLAVAPFELEFERVDWHTVYGIQQCVAERFIDKGRILLAGEAAHTHSSALAQGMNTGVHDACSLSWRLAGVLNGWYGPEVLQTYEDERKAASEELIENDKIASALISRHKPERYKNRPEDPMRLLSEFLEETAGFNTGLGISYAENLLNDAGAAALTLIRPGHRAPDMILHRPGLRNGLLNIRLLETMKFNAKFRVVVFSGKPHLNHSSLVSLREQVDKHEQRFSHAVEFLTIIDGHGTALDEFLAVRKFGKSYWDPASQAHTLYGVCDAVGAMIIVRPDGLIGSVAALEDFEAKVVPYLERIVKPRPVKKKALVNGAGAHGTLINPFENNLEFSIRNAEMHAR